MMTSAGFRRNLLRDVSRSFYLSLRLLPGRMRPPCALGYLLARLSDTIADTGSLPVPTRLQLLRDFRVSLHGSLPFRQLHESLSASLLPCVEHPGERRLVEATESCFRDLASLEPRLAHAVSEVVQTITTGQESDLRNFPAPSLHPESATLHALPAAAGLIDYTDRVAGCVGRFWTRTGFLCYPRFSSLPALELEDLGTRFGQALQLVNILRDLPADLDSGRCYLPREELEGEGWRDGLPWREQTVPLQRVAAAWETRAEAGLRDGLQYANSLTSRRAKAATALPALLGLKTLDLLRLEPDLRFASRIKTSRASVRHALRCAFVAALTGRPVRPPSFSPSR